ncbi:inner centromere protein A-like [Pistacia vera]|uniref:inner centromere protein A-like n=1 Tax=Pistacia vera TaxID=55513 RepID=UPI001262F624|nr:inner centromere protein A-like [Pistacia vera]
MATEAETPEPVSLTKGQSDGLVDEISPGELKEFQGLLNLPPANAEYSVETGKMQVPTGPETVNTRIQGNVEIAEGDRFFESPSAVEIACEVSKQMDNVKIEIADKTGNAGSEVMEESEEKPEKNDKSPVIENLTGNSSLTAEIEESNLIGKGILKEERSIDPHSEVITDQDVSDEDKSMEKETVDMHENEKVESNEEVLGIPEAKLDQNGEASIHTPDLTVVSLNKDGETIMEEKSGETNSKEIENEAEKSTNLVGEEKSPEAIESSEIIGNGKDENKISMNNGTGDAFTQRIAVLPDIQSYEEENLKISEAEEEIVYKPYATPATEASSIHEELELKENTEVIEKIAKDDCISSAKDESHESPEQEGDGSFMKHAGTLGVNEGAAATDASSSEDRNEDGSTFMVTKDKTGDTEIINALEDSQSGMSSHEERSEGLQQNEPEEEKLERSLSVVDEDFIVATSTEYAQTIEEEASIKIHEERFERKITDALDHSQSGTSDHEEKPENLPQNEPEEEKLEGSLSVVDVDSSIVASTESAETTSVQGETPFKSQEESFEEIMKEDLPIHTDTDSKNEIPEDENVPQIELNEMIEGVEVEVPNENANDIHDTHPLIEVAKQTEEINLDNVSSLEPQGKAQEVNEATPEEEKHIEDQPEPYQSWNLTILEHPSTEGKVKTEPTPQTNETDIKELDDVPGLESDEKSTIKGNIASEKSKEENYIEQVVELDSIEQVPVKSLEDEEKNADEATGEISENSKTERAAESIEHEASKTTEGPQEIPDTCHVKEEESLQKEGKNITATESSREEKPEQNETFSSEANETPFQMEEGAPQTLEEAPHKEETANETEENNDTKGNKIAIEEDFQVVVETSDASKSTESTIPEPKTEISNTVAEDEIKMEDTEELHESCKDTGKDKEAEKQDSKEDYVILPEPSEEKTVQCSEENKEEEEASKIEACTQLEATSVTSVQTQEEESIVGQSRELEAEKIEQSSEEGHTVTDISSESIEQETVEIYLGDANEAEKSGGDLNPESVEQAPVKNLEDEEKTAKDFKGENFEHGMEETAESIVHETCKTNESPREIVETFQVKQGDSLQCEENNVTVTESSSEEKPLENETAEQLEKPLSLESNENKAFISDSDKVHSQMEEGPPQNLEEASPKEEEKLERFLSAVDEDFIVGASAEYVESIEDEASIKIHEERFEEKITDALEHSQSGTSDREEKPENLPQNEPEEEKLEGSLSVVDVDSSIVASTESASVKGETPFKSQEESLEEIMKEDLPIHTDTDSKNEIPEDKNVPQIELDKVSSFEPEGKPQEVNEATPEEEKHIEDPPEPYQSWNLTILEHPSTEGKVKTEPTPQTNETDIKELKDVPGLESDEKSTIKGNIASEKSNEENYIEQVVELDSVEQVPVKSLEDEEKNAEEATGEISENSRTERAAESIEHEKEGKNITATELYRGETRENETFSSEANETPSMEEGAPQNLEEAPHKKKLKMKQKR